MTVWMRVEALEGKAKAWRPSMDGVLGRRERERAMVPYSAQAVHSMLSVGLQGASVPQKLPGDVPQVEEGSHSLLRRL